MSMPFYVAPEQVMKDRADYARKGIARGRSLAAVVCREGIALVAENPGARLRKISEIYDRLAFAGVGRYNEFDSLRRAGVRHADVKGYQFSREDVEGRGLANAYAQMLGNIFTHEMKPMEVEILVAELGHEPDDDLLFKILFDGQLSQDDTVSVLGGDGEAVSQRLRDALGDETPELGRAVSEAVAALADQGSLGPGDLEVALLDRSRERRCFRRIEADELTTLLEG